MNSLSRPISVVQNGVCSVKMPPGEARLIWVGAGQITRGAEGALFGRSFQPRLYGIGKTSPCNPLCFYFADKITLIWFSQAKSPNRGIEQLVTEIFSPNWNRYLTDRIKFSNNGYPNRIKCSEKAADIKI
jgi:hypothetical protein